MQRARQQQPAALPRSEGTSVEVRWLRVGGDADAAACARDIFGMLTGLRQRPLDAPVILGAPTSIGAGATAQAAEPISFARASDQLAGVQWADYAGGMFVLVTESGEIIEPRTAVRDESSLKVGHVTRRRAMTINIRPGEGGHRRRVADEIDPLEGLDGFASQFGEIVWWSVGGGATIGVLDLNKDGNTVLCHRLSSEDRNETLIAQLKPTLALANRQPEILIPRYALFAVNMSGVREVRPDRAGPPPPWLFERDDMLLLDKWINEGWVDHVIWRDPDRIARDVLPGETLIKRWRENRVGLWLASYGRQLNYRTDKLQLRAMNMVASEDRDKTVDKLQLARLNKGPLAGNGWGPLKFGFKKERGRVVVDPVQWAWVLRVFELADAGEFHNSRGISTRRLADALGEEGCPFDHETLRRILKEPIYVTGEWTQSIRGIPVEQRPIALTQPVPLDRFERVQNLFALRQGNSTVTPLGEFLFNAIECSHKRCAGTTSNSGKKILIKGRLKKGREQEPRIYAHAPTCSPQCKTGGRGRFGGYAWPREQLERPVMEKIRELATHPELLQQAARAARHNVATTSSRLTKAQRAELELEIERLERQLDALADEQVEKAAAGGTIDLETYENLCERVKRKINGANRRLQADEAAVALADDRNDDISKDRVKTFLEVMSLDVPDDAAIRQLRARIFQRIVSKIEVDDSGDGPITLTVHGHLAPEDAPAEFSNPLLACADLLDAYESLRAGNTPAPDAEAARWAHVQTDLSISKDKAVWENYGDLLAMPGQDARLELDRSRIASTLWAARRRHAAEVGVAAWRLKIILEA
jgi:DNA invertase Pin-like site-specific DNA recombinase